jgi:hypothetical protein
MRSRATRYSLNAGWRAMAGAGLLAAFSVTACSASPASSPSAAGNGQPSNPAVTATGTAPVVQSSAPPPSGSPSSAVSAGIQNVLVSSAVRSQLTAAYLAMRQIPASDVSGTYPGSVYYAYDPATNTYWARAVFVPSKTAPLNVLANFQDGGSEGLYTKIGSGPWQIHHSFFPEVCADEEFFPKAVLAAWALPTSIPAGLNC